MKELADAFALALTGDGVELRKGAPHKTGGGGQIAGHPHHAHAAAVCVQRQIRCKAVFGGLCAQVQVVVQIEELEVEGRIVGHDAHRVIIDVQAVRHRLHDKAFLPVRDHPVQGRGGKLRAERCVRHVELRQLFLYLGNAGALAQQPWNELKGADVVHAVLGGMIGTRIAREIRARPCSVLFHWWLRSRAGNPPPRLPCR